MTRAMLTEADLLTAIRWRLEGVPGEVLEIGRQAAFCLAGISTPIRDDESRLVAILESLRGFEDRREPWGLLCALIALEAKQRGSTATFWAAGLEVWRCWEQAHRNSGGKRDRLTDLIIAHVTTRPDVSPGKLFDEFLDQASLGFDETLVDHDPERDALVFQPGEGKALENISRTAFIRRVQRIRREISACSLLHPVRQQPASVAVCG